MKILVENGCHHLKNLGDVAMLQVAVGRLKGLWPGARIGVVADDPMLLMRYCPEAYSVPAHGHRLWFEGSLFGRLHQIAPRAISQTLKAVEDWVRDRYPAVARALFSIKMRLRGRVVTDMTVFMQELSNADVVVVSGGGDLNDAFASFALTLLGVLKTANHAGKTTAMFGQGLGPINNPASRLPNLCRRTLTALDVIGIRERRVGPAMLKAFGVEASRVMVTGDDAIELAYEQRVTALGTAIGINLRISEYAGVTRALATDIRQVLHSVAVRQGADIIPVPISLIEVESDLESVRELLTGSGRADINGADLTTPTKVIAQVGRCRLVVAGSYHAAVFALAQGIPAVCLAKSEYYKDKFLGLAEQFGDGCEVILLNDADFRNKMAQAIENAWSSAERVRPGLLDAALRQIETGKSCYARLRDVVESKGSTAAPEPFRGGAL